MIMLPRKARPRRSPRVVLVGIDGKPLPRPDATTWPSWTDNWYFEPGESSHDLAGHITAPSLDPDDVELRRDGSSLWAEMMIEASLPPVNVESDAEFLARLEAEEAAERERVLAQYQPSEADMADYRAYCEALESGAMHPAEAGRFEFSPIRSGQITETELAMQAAGMAL